MQQHCYYLPFFKEMEVGEGGVYLNCVTFFRNGKSYALNYILVILSYSLKHDIG